MAQSGNTDRCPPARPLLTSFADLGAHKLPGVANALGIGDVEQHRLESVGGPGGQQRSALLRQTGGYHVKALPVHTFGQQVPEATVAAGDKHMLCVEDVEHVGVSDVPADENDRNDSAY